MTRYLILFVFFNLTMPGLICADAAKVAVTVKPIHSLVSGVMKGVGEPALIMSGSASPHHYSLRPSERRTLAEAELIFWVGPELETFMPRILESLDAPARAVALIASPGLVHLPARHSHDHSASASRIDPHIWLSAKNAHVMVDVIADKLIELDKKNAGSFERNRLRLHSRISDTDDRIRRILSGKNAAFLSYHDAYQYFEKSYGLNHAGFVSSGDEISPSARYVRELRNTIRDQQLHCLFYEAPGRPALVDTLTAGFDVTALELDAIGLRLHAGENAWFEIMRNLAETYDSCL